MHIQSIIVFELFIFQKTILACGEFRGVGKRDGVATDTVLENFVHLFADGHDDVSRKFLFKEVHQ